MSSIKVLTSEIQIDPVLREIHHIYRRFPEPQSNENIYFGHSGMTGPAGATGSMCLGNDIYSGNNNLIIGRGATGASSNVLLGNYCNSQYNDCVVVGHGPRTTVPVAGSILLGHRCEPVPAGATGATGAYFCVGSGLEAVTAENGEVVDTMIPLVYNGVKYVVHATAGNPLP